MTIINSTELFQPHFPVHIGGYPIKSLRVTKTDAGCFVVEVTDSMRKKGAIIAACKIEEDSQSSGYFFTTGHEDAGYKELCLLLKRKGVRGKYLECLDAIMCGVADLDEDMKKFSSICFDCKLLDGEAPYWKIDADESFISACVEKRMKTILSSSEEEESRP
jgi:hypothetical protein